MKRSTLARWSIRMLLTLSTLVSLSLFWRTTSADDPRVPETLPLANQASKRDAGSAGIFRGKIVIAEILLEDPESGWSDSERVETHRRMDAAIAFLARQAEHFKQPLEIARIEPKLVRWDQLLPTNSTAHPSWTEQVIRAATGASAEAWMQ